MGGDLTSLFGGSTLANLLGGGGGASANIPGADNVPVPASDVGGLSFDQMFGGPTAPEEAITGNMAGIGPTGAPDLGGQLSTAPTGSQMGPEGPAGPPQALQAPQAPQTAAPLPPAQQAAQVNTGPFSPAQQQTVAGPTGWTQPADPNQRVSQGFADTGENQQLRQPTPNQQVANRWGRFQQQPPPQQIPDWLQTSAQQLHDTGGRSGVPDTSPADQASQDAAPSPAAAETRPPTQGAGAATQPPSTPQTGAAGQGGGPGAGGLGRIASDIEGIMAGNPMSLGNLVQDVMRMMGGGMPGMGMGFPGGQMGQGGGMIPRGYTAQNAPGWAPGFGPETGRFRATPQEVQQGLQGGQPGTASGIPPRPRPPGAQPAPGAAQPTPSTAPPTDDSGTPLPSQPRQQDVTPAPSNPRFAGTAAAQPLAATEIRVPPASIAGLSGGAPMRPSQSSVDRSRFANENNDQTAFKAAWMVNGEVGPDAPVRQQVVQLETAFNRAQSDETSLAHALLDSRQRGDDGYYSGRPGQVPTYRMSARPTPEQFAAFKANVWNPVMRGSNLSDVGWGPMTGNASADVAERAMQRKKGYRMGAESYFRERNVALPAIGGAPRQIMPGARASAQPLQEMGVV